ncbi:MULTISPECIES: hypothetical protein [Nonlabens]|uniref:Uncharacterized protein n=1 Tax=Nonlabens ulvanivorans TaxID=906888 RepID=A0A084JXF1_NONUL|nr:hypothetical protein [Nonlabens ulvanivorans]KEZ93635.1 hypothetical protein IL45_05365 [Nonlabens ulvanivorans]PRX14222.1 hypothetical protein LY02_01252 [Nonlabens ulvanivorans]WOI23229.1 hypothetical protein R1T42_02025 [Nonlabens ulvanivorans]GAK76040.1 hypothetical protein JCM19296_1637 [Nonlabens ulvanivorans]GAK99523.1 hypothetical protein JCM19314_3568 [Nonlabens ulvanivorans]
MQNKESIKFFLGLAFLGLGAWKIYERFMLNKDVSNFQLVGSIFLVGLGLYRGFEYFKNKKTKSE